MKRPFFRSLYGKLALAIAVALVPVTVLTVWGYWVDVRESEENVLDFQRLAAEAVAVQVEETFDAALSVAWAIANDPVTQTSDPQQLNAHLERLLGRHPIFDSIGVFDTNGNSLGWSRKTESVKPRINISNRSYFQTVIGTNGPALSDVVELRKNDGAVGVVAAVPVRNDAGQVTGIVTVLMTTEQLSKWYEEARLRPGQTILLLDRNGHLVFHSAIRGVTAQHMGIYRQISEIRRALSGMPQTIAKFQSPLDSDVKLGAFVPTKKYHWVVGVTTPRDIALAPVNAALKRQLAGVLGTLLLSGLIAVFTAKKLTSPLSRLREHAQAIGQGKLDQRVSVKTGDEFEELGEAFNEMSLQIQNRDAHLRASEERFRATFEEAAVGIAQTSVDGNWLWVNDRLCEILGYSREELVQQTFPQITHPDDAARDVALVHELLEGRFEKYALEKRCRRKSGRYIWVSFTVTLVRNPDGEPAYFIAVIEDIQRRKELEDDRKQLLQREQAARANAEAASRAKDQLLAMVSHELRTPLTPVLPALDLLDDEAVFSTGAKGCLKMIRGNIEMEARLIEDLLDLTAIRQAKLELRRDAVDIHETLQLVVSVLEHEIDAKRLDIQFDLQAEQYTAFVDSGRIQQVFWNLLSNSVKYTPAGGSITIHSRSNSEAVIVSIEDTGIGIAPDLKPKLFDAFEQGEQTLTRRYAGLGLGLTISKALVEMHGGKITAESDGVGKGAIFTVELPLLKKAFAERMPTRPPAFEAAHPKRRILLVEDNPDTQEVLVKLLQRSGHEVTTASSVREALETAQSGHPDLLVTDIGLPDASGWELLREVKKTQLIPAIAISGFGTPEDRQKSQEAGFAMHLVKPINYQVLKDAIEQVAG